MCCRGWPAVVGAAAGAAVGAGWQQWGTLVLYLEHYTLGNPLKNTASMSQPAKRVPFCCP